MAHSLSSVRDQVEINLMDTSNLIWSTTVIDEALRAALLDLSRVYGHALTLSGLDEATETTFDDQDVYVLIKGAVAHALVFRAVGRYEEATPEPKLIPHLATQATAATQEFRSLLSFVDLRLKQKSSDSPISSWGWEERSGF